MNITSTQARFSATWTVDILIGEGSVPDRPVPYSTTGAVYRPISVKLTFTTAASNPDPAELRLAPQWFLFLDDARTAIRLNGTEMYGARLKKDGQPGQQVVTERFYGQDKAPEWLRGLITTTQEQLA